MPQTRCCWYIESAGRVDDEGVVPQALGVTIVLAALYDKVAGTKVMTKIRR